MPPSEIDAARGTDARPVLEGKQGIWAPLVTFDTTAHPLPGQGDSRKERELAT